MITNQQMMEAVSLPLVADLSFDTFAPQDLVNLIMQRSEIIHDQPRSGRIIRAWSSGNAAPALALVHERGIELARRAAAIIFLEYLEIRHVIEKVNPRSVADIGCGYAMFLWKDHKCKLNLIDLETSEERHFGYDETGAAYSSLSVARAFLLENGVDKDDITCLNPRVDNLDVIAPIDLAMSYISCGYHYPVQTYGHFFNDFVAKDGTIILDLRSRRLSEGMGFLENFGEVSTLVDAASGSAKRVLVQKG